MNPVTLIIVVVVLFLVFGGGYGWRSGWPYGPHTVRVGTVLLVLLVLYLAGVFR